MSQLVDDYHLEHFIFATVTKTNIPNLDRLD